MTIHWLQKRMKSQWTVTHRSPPLIHCRLAICPLQQASHSELVTFQEHYHSTNSISWLNWQETKQSVYDGWTRIRLDWSLYRVDHLHSLYFGNSSSKAEWGRKILHGVWHAGFPEKHLSLHEYRKTLRKKGMLKLWIFIASSSSFFLPRPPPWSEPKY